jgi:hypothetical protein
VLQAGLLPTAGLSPTALATGGFSASANGAVAQVFTLPSSLLSSGSTGTLLYNASFPLNGIGGFQSDLRLSALSVSLQHIAQGAPPASPRLRLPELLALALPVGSRGVSTVQACRARERGEPALAQALLPPPPLPL